MIGKGLFPNRLIFFFCTIILFLSPHILLSEDNKQAYDRLGEAVRRIIEIRSLPDMKYLYTLDGQHVLLAGFYAKCHSLFPQCCLFEKFYYWQNEIRTVVSNTENGAIKHKIRCYYNCLSTFCPKSCDPRKTHGDVAEFYDQSGKFMGLAVYMGVGKYCSLPYDGYKKWSWPCSVICCHWQKRKRVFKIADNSNWVQCDPSPTWFWYTKNTATPVKIYKAPIWDLIQSMVIYIPDLQFIDVQDINLNAKYFCFVK